MFLVRHLLPADLLTPLGAYLALRPEGASLLLESCDQGERVGRYSFVLLERGDECRLPPPAKGWVQALRRLAGPREQANLRDPASSLGPSREPLPVGVGCAGYLGFEALGATEPELRLPAQDSLHLPGLWVKRFPVALVLDHLHQVAELQILCEDPGTGLGEASHLRAVLARGSSEPREVPCAPRAMALLPQEDFEAMVHQAQERILDGDIYQLVPSQRFRVEDPPPPLRQAPWLPKNRRKRREPESRRHP